ncbi:hypothetical protein ACFQ2C_15145 [Sphingobacterium daejeonense]|uniref:Uncharacterized protein n=1 Tax=Sphingobacterium daejeonense TaxID=371142 RepID=A0ABW3RNZ3_9SPHI
MKSILIIIIFWNIMFIAKAQEISDSPVSLIKPLHSVSAYLNGLMYRFETPIAKKQTLFTEVGLENDLIIKGDNSNEYELASVIYAQLGVGYRNYYNIYKREAKGKRTGLNGSNYYGINGNIFPFKNIYRSKNYDSLKRHYELLFIPHNFR